MGITLVSKRQQPSEKPGTNNLGPVRSAISTLIRKMRSFDVATIDCRDDWKANALATLINNTLADIFDPDSQEYEEYSIQSFDTLPHTGVDFPLAEIRLGYQKGLNDAVQKLNSLLDTLDGKTSVDERAAGTASQGASAGGSWIDGKVSLITMRAKLGNKRAPSSPAPGTASGTERPLAAKPEAGIAKQEAIEVRPGELKFEEDTARTKNRDSDDGAGKLNQEKTATTPVADEKRKTEPADAGKEGNAPLDHTEGMQETPGDEELNSPENDKDEAVIAAILADETMPAPAAAAPGASFDNLVGGISAPEARRGEATRPHEPVELLSAEFRSQVPSIESGADRAQGVGPLFEEPGETFMPADELLSPGSDEQPIVGTISTPFERFTRLSLRIIKGGLDATRGEEPLAEIAGDPGHDALYADTVLEESAEPEAPMPSEIHQVPEMLLWECAVEKGWEIPGDNQTAQVLTESLVGSSTELAPIGPYELDRFATMAAETNDSQATIPSAHLDADRISRIETAVLALVERTVEPSPTVLLEKETSAFEEDRFAQRATRQVTEPPSREITAHESVRCDFTIGAAIPDDHGANAGHPVEERPLAGVRPVYNEEMTQIDRDVDGPAGKAGEETAPLPEETAAEAAGEPHPHKVLRSSILPGRGREETPAHPAEDFQGIVTDPVAPAPEVKQNPFAVDDLEKGCTQPKTRSAAELEAQISAIMTRIDDLRNFDIASITERYDPRVRELRESVNNTIADIFGRNTRDYWDYSLTSFEAAHVALGSLKSSPAELKRSYQEGFDKAITKLTMVVESLKSRSGRLENEEDQEEEPVIANGPAPASLPDHKENVTMVEVQKVPSDETKSGPVSMDRVNEKAMGKPSEKEIAPAPEVKQNPFAVDDLEKGCTQPKTRSAAELEAQISAIMTRIDDLRNFDIASITERYDPRVRELRESVNNTIADIFGRNTRDYWDYSLTSFEAAHVALGSLKSSPAELKRSYQEGFDKAITKLTMVVESLKSKLGPAGQSDPQ